MTSSQGDTIIQLLQTMQGAQTTYGDGLIAITLAVAVCLSLLAGYLIGKRQGGG